MPEAGAEPSRVVQLRPVCLQDPPGGPVLQDVVPPDGGRHELADVGQDVEGPVQLVKLQPPGGWLGSMEEDKEGKNVRMRVRYTVVGPLEKQDGTALSELKSFNYCCYIFS